MRPIRALIALLSAALAGAPALAQPVTSPGPDSVSVAIYADPDRWVDTPINPAWLRGYALISEKRTITIPKGRAVIRFEGVAGGILPESAIVTGLPDGVREKNLDADLLSARSLYARSLGRPVTIRRTRGGRTVEERAIIRSGPDGAAVLETREGIVAVDCRGSEALIYDAVPAGLSAKPTLSVETEAAEARQVTVTLSYLAWGFDWQANYVATMRDGGRSADLFAWVTLANGDVTSFADAATMVVGGRVNREGGGAPVSGLDDGEPFEFQCLSHVEAREEQYAPMPEPAPMADSGERDAIAVTGMRMSLSASTPITVVREALGDLQLYRVPHRTTVAAQSQKQVALLNREAVPVDVIYRSYVSGNYVSPPELLLRAQNREARGLGLPLPRGKVAVFEPRGDTSLLIGEGSIGDKAVGEEVEVRVAQATQVHASKRLAVIGGRTDQALTVTNANPFPVRFEAGIVVNDGIKIGGASARLGRKDGRPLWAVQVPANGSVTLTYRTDPVRRR